MRTLFPLHRPRQRGFVLLMMAAAGIALMGATGLAIDLGRLYIHKQEAQSYADAAAIAAALELDGTQAGITRAKNAVLNSANNWNMNTSAVPTPTVEFSTSINGTWAATPASAVGVTFVRVRPTLPEKLYFLPLLNGNKYTQNIPAKAVAAQVSINTFGKGLGPYTAVGQNTTGPNFGLIRGTQYSIQWPAYNPDRAPCRQNNPDGCYIKRPCAGDSDAAKWAVAQNWGASTSGYWGFNSSADIRESVLDGKQTAPVSVGQNIFPLMNSGTMNAQAGYLDERSRQDLDNANNNIDNYMNSSTHNGRRIMIVPVVNPVSTSTTTILGWGAFLLLSNGTQSTDYYTKTVGNDPYCAIYIGPYSLGSNDGGAATSGSGAYYITLVQ